MREAGGRDYRRSLAFVGVLVVALGVVGGAAAVTAMNTTVSGVGVLTVTAAPGEINNITIDPVTGVAPVTTVKDTGVAAITRGAGCGFDVPDPQTALCSTGTRAAIDLGDQSDTIHYNENTAATIEAGEGADRVFGGPRNDTLRAGDDTGVDSLFGGAGADVYDGGPAGQGAHDSAGFDGAGQPVTVTMDGVANDGVANEHDNVLESIEDVSAGGGPITVTGSAFANRFDTSAEDDVLRGLGGADQVFAGGGSDYIDGGAGADRVNAGPGNDEIEARDGASDVIDCSDGVDVVHADRGGDTMIGCERIDFLGPVVGVFRLRPSSARVRAGRTVVLTLTWRTPGRWRDLRTVDLRARDGKRTVAVVRFREDGSPTGTLSLGSRSSGTPGSARTLRSHGASLLLAKTTVTGSGPTGKSVTIRLALRLGRSLAGRALTLQLGAADDYGHKQRFRRAGTLRVVG